MVRRFGLLGIFSVLAVLLVASFALAYDYKNGDVSLADDSEDFQEVIAPADAGFDVVINKPTGNYDNPDNVPLDFSIITSGLGQKFTCYYYFVEDGASVKDAKYFKFPDCDEDNFAEFDVPEEGDYEIFVRVESGSKEVTVSSDFSVTIPNTNTNTEEESSDDSSGGGSSTFTTWKCTGFDESQCINGFVTQICVRENPNWPVREPRPVLFKECDPSGELLSSQAPEEDNSFFSLITGAVIGGGNRNTLGVLAFLVVLGIGYFVATSMREMNAEKAVEAGTSSAKAPVKPKKVAVAAQA